MTARYGLALILFFAATAFSGAPANTLADVQPQLKQALLRDDACMKSTEGEELPAQLQSTVLTEEINAAGRQAGIIAAPHDECHCRDENCKTFVYLKSGEDFRLAFAGSFASLRPMKVVKHGLPSLSGKFQVNDAQEETTIFDWTGTNYQPSLCATVTQHGHERLPRISQHPCKARKQ